MSLPSIDINRQQGGLGRPLTGSDYISGMVFFTGSLPSGFTSTYNKKAIFQLSDAVNLGINNSYSDETKATGTYKITTKGNTGDTLKITIAVPSIASDGTSTTTTVNLGTYTVVSAANTITLQATAIVALINAGTYIHGFSATLTGGSSDTVTISAKAGLGVRLNSGTPITVTITGAFAGTLTQFSGGVGSKLAVYYYHISEFFRANPKGKLWLGFYPVPVTYNFVECSDLQNFSKGEIRQMLVYNDVARTATNVSSDCTALQAAQNTSELLHMPFSVVYSPNIAAISDLSTLENLQLLQAYKVSVNISQDGGSDGANLYLSTGKSITTGGHNLGTISASKVNESIAWVAKFNATNGIELNVPAFSNGTLLSSVSSNLLDQLDNYKYVFLRTFIGRSGSYYSFGNTAVINSSDYATIENNRVFDKVARQAYIASLPNLNSPLVLNSDGTLTDVTISTLSADINTQLKTMENNGELSDGGNTYNIAVIDPSQNVLATSTVYISIPLLINGVAKNIVINIGFQNPLTA